MKSFSAKFVVLALIVVNGCFSKDKAEPQQPATSTPVVVDNKTYRLVQVFKSVELDLPLELVGDGQDNIYVVEQKGVIKVLPVDGQANATAFLDIQKKVESGGEKGLLGLAFHPDFKNNGYFFVNYTRGNPLQTVIARYKVSPDDPLHADANSELVLLTYDQPYGNHNGGKIAFGNDGMLYIAAGDGGSGGDPGNRAQNRQELLGKILRIDVNTPSNGKPYSIPSDNPFANNTTGYRGEIYAYGLRNPWRFNFDRQTGMLWAGDVGQNKIEEVDIIEKGGNYGWNIMEADECFKGKSCDSSGLILPITSYEQGSNTGRSVTGGYVCRDKTLPGLNGKYIYGDFVSGNIWALSYTGKQATNNQKVGTLKGGLSSFGEDDKHNLYLLAYGDGKIYRLTEE